MMSIIYSHDSPSVSTQFNNEWHGFLMDLMDI